jgi:acylphosphatase
MMQTRATIIVKGEVQRVKRREGGEREKFFW